MMFLVDFWVLFGNNKLWNKTKEVDITGKVLMKIFLKSGHQKWLMSWVLFMPMEQLKIVEDLRGHAIYC